MNEQLEKILAEILEKALKAAEQTGEFVLDTAPELLQEFYRWHTVKYSLGLLLGVLLLSYAIWLKRKFDKYGCGDDEAIPYVAGIVFTSIPGMLIFCVNLYWLAFVLAAPKVYLIEYFLK